MLLSLVLPRALFFTLAGGFWRQSIVWNDVVVVVGKSSREACLRYRR